MRWNLHVRARWAPSWASVALLILVGLLQSFVLADIEPVSDFDVKEAGTICSGAKSRATRLSLSENFYPEVEREGYELPANCPLAKPNDMLLPLEAHKQSRSTDRLTISSSSYPHPSPFIYSSSLSMLGRHPPFRIRNRQHSNGDEWSEEGSAEEREGEEGGPHHRWKCRLCKRTFAGEQYLDLHLKKKHPEVWSEGGNVCLADYCDILRCNEYMEEGLPVAQTVSSCNAETIEKRKFECRNIMHKCFPLEGGEVAHRLNKQFTRKLCDDLSCSVGDSKRTKWAKVSNILWWILASCVGVGLILFYGLVWLWRRNQRLSSDLRRLSSKRQMSRLRSWGKVKGY